MARYHVDNRMAGSEQAVTTTYKTLVSVVASSAPILRRGRCVAIAVGADGAPNATDCQIVWTVQRITVNPGGTGGTTATPNPIVPADSASSMFSQVNFTSEGTYTLPIWTRCLNQRASMQWVAQDTDAMLLWPATATASSNGNGLVFLVLSPTYASGALTGVEYEDL
jgi:hypothetical protein